MYGEANQGVLRVVVAQIGGREHYSLPRVCHSHASLAGLHTDYWRPVPPYFESIAASKKWSLVNRAAARYSSDLPASLVTNYACAATYWNLRARVANNRNSLYKVHAGWGSSFAKKVSRALLDTDFSTFLGYSSASLEALERAKDLGALSVVDEIAPTHLEEEIIKQEHLRYPGWEQEYLPLPTEFLERLSNEWEIADRIIVNSRWTKKALGGFRSARGKDKSAAINI